MRISDWSSDVCSSDLLTDELLPQAANNGSAHDSSKTGFRFLIDFPPIHGTRYVCGVRWRPGGRNAFWPHGAGKTNAGARAAWNRHCGEAEGRRSNPARHSIRRCTGLLRRYAPRDDVQRFLVVADLDRRERGARCAVGDLRGGSTCDLAVALRDVRVRCSEHGGAAVVGLLATAGVERQLADRQSVGSGKGVYGSVA